MVWLQVLDRIIEPTLERFEMKKLDGKDDFGIQKYKMMGYLEIQGLFLVLKGDFTVLQNLERRRVGCKDWSKEGWQRS